MSDTPIKDRALRIAAVTDVRKSWEKDWFWENHTHATFEFQLLDVLRDIRSVLTFIAIILLLIAIGG